MRTDILPLHLASGQAFRVSRASYGLIAGVRLFSFRPPETTMGNKIVTKADRKATPRPTPLPRTSPVRHGRGQRISLERGVNTHHKKNPGKRHR